MMLYLFWYVQEQGYVFFHLSFFKSHFKIREVRNSVSIQSKWKTSQRGNFSFQGLSFRSSKIGKNKLQKVVKGIWTVLQEQVYKLNG